MFLVVFYLFKIFLVRFNLHLTLQYMFHQWGKHPKTQIILITQ